MAQHAPPARGARLGRAAGARTGSVPTESPVNGVVLLLPGASRLSPGPMRPLARALARAGGADGLVTHAVIHGGESSRAEQARWAADEAVRRYGDVPVCLAGYDAGGLAALRAAGHGAVNSVLALAPCLEDGTPAGSPEPVKHLSGRQVLIVHGTNDARSDPEVSFRLAERAKKANRSTCRFEVHSDGHGLREHQAEVVALGVDFVLGAVFSGRYSRPVTDALAAPPPLGLRMPLASGFGRSLRG
ncbi:MULTISPECIES: dienelactone hydrolase [Streptomyces]|uniref:dienelactone hydrolase n=1 Tax=Streptomyces TaxID=1883 RepID=UPI0005F8ECDA|nr:MULTISPECIES: dienelactone hydrolase [Streptomyces]KJY22651.1 dienelactone hydrolase [Streptomyces sp. NRRL S-104]KOU44157.1 dienelactone hydrolase [Streptomyces sp. WM6373]KOU65224.1 dienelactone hydrolase [Streptomyces sp. IGB124]KOU86679.1 dienelactone hydrolase [Streptomyces sp. XY58]KOV11339.1 dienelactone hydrolase [Streptomyces sp. XY37]